MRLSIPISAIVVALFCATCPAPAAAQLGANALKCKKAILVGASRYGSVVQRTLRRSIESNLAGLSSQCDGGFACIGGANHGRACATNSDCGSSGPIPGCYPQSGKGLAGAFIAAKRRFRHSVAGACTKAGITLAEMGFPTGLCPAPAAVAMTFDDVVDCIIDSAAGDLDEAKFVDVYSEPLARAAGTATVATPAQVCGLTLSSVLHIGVLDPGNSVGESGPTARLDVTGCDGNLCDLASTNPIGNLTSPPDEISMGSLSFCLVTVSGDAGNGTSESGQLDLATGYQSSYAPISTAVHAGPCPKCSEGVCDSGPNAGQPCLNSGSTDTGCQPTTSSRFATIPNPLVLSTEGRTLTQLPGKPGICGNCSTSISIGCQVDEECPSGETCSYAYTQPGFHGDAAVTSVSVQGAPGPYMPKMAGLFCTGRTNNSLVDLAVTGLPGPVRYVQFKQNAFQF